MESKELLKELGWSEELISNITNANDELLASRKSLGYTINESTTLILTQTDLTYNATSSTIRYL